MYDCLDETPRFLDGTDTLGSVLKSDQRFWPHFWSGKSKRKEHVVTFAGTLFPCLKYC